MTNHPFHPTRILVPTDFSDLATRALGYATELARRTDGSLYVLYADPFLPPPHFTATQVEGIAEALGDSVKAALRELEHYIESHVGEVPATAVIIQDLPVPAIMGWANQNAADVIVMGTHGRSGFNRMMLGSVTERVLRESEIPLLTVRMENPSPSDAPAKPKILCPVNFSEVAHESLDHALALGDLLGGEVTVLHVVEGDDRLQMRMVQHVEQWIPPEHYRHVSVARMILRGDAAEQVVNFARRNETDLIVLGAQHKRFSDTSVLGTTTVRVTRHAPCPVLTVSRKPGASLARDSSDSTPAELTTQT